jgi:hypothetical protein
VLVLWSRIESNFNKKVKYKLSQNWLHVPLSSGNRNRNRNGYSGNGSELTVSSCCFVSLTFSSFKGVFVAAISAATAPHARRPRDRKEKDTFDDCKEKEVGDEWRDGLLNLHCALVLLNFDTSPVVETATLLGFTTAHALQAILPDSGQQKSGSPSLLSYLIQYSNPPTISSTFKPLNIEYSLNGRVKSFQVSWLLRNLCK